MEVRLQTNAKEVAKRVKKKGKELSDSVKRALSITALSGMGVIKERTKDSRGYKGGAFKPYEGLYGAFRVAHGRSAVPDLMFTGKMLGSMTTKSSSSQAEIFFASSTESKKAAMNNKKRPFFGFTRREEKKLGKIFFRALK